MTRILLVISFLSLTMFDLRAQETVYWANEVIDVSSEYSPLEYSAIQALHKPNVYPAGGDNPNAWRPKSEDAKSFIMVSFEKAVQAKQIAIAESENPGAITKVVAYDPDYNEYTLFELTPRSIPLQQRLLNLFFEDLAYPIEAIRIELDGSQVEGFNAIDAIGISNSNLPINVLIDIAQNVNQDLEVEKLSTNVNSNYIEHSPLLSPDGKRLYFSRQYHPGNQGGVNDNEDIWYSELDPETGEWLPAKNIGAPLNNEGPNFISSIVQQGENTVLLLGNRYEKKGRMVSGVSMATIDKDGNITPPVNIDIEDEYNYSANADFFLTFDTKYLVSAVERDDSFGDRDLYVSFQKRDGTWSAPKNLGQTVNTIAEEASPYLSVDTKTMYFSTSGFKGYGGKDIYVSKRLDDSWTNWSPPENLGKGINTTGDDVYFNIPTTGKHVYFTRGDVDEDTDIFSFRADDFYITEPDQPLINDTTSTTTTVVAVVEDPVDTVQTTEEPIAQIDTVEVVEEVIITVAGKVLNEKTKTPVAATVLVERLPDGVELGTVSSNPETGEYTFQLKPGARYGFLAQADGYLSRNENIDLNETNGSTNIGRDLFLTPIETGVVVELNNIFFDFDKSVLKTSSYPELERILKLLSDQKVGKVQISGHTDSTGPNEYNMKLSERRAKSVYDYFIQNGISKDRLIMKFFGEEQPAVPNSSSANKSKNRRVEFKVVEAI
ncbi:MAG: OmpA family protein [bacterium]|nr:OmpA family protein [bacterium]